MAEWTVGQFPIRTGVVSGNEQDSISFDGILVDDTTKKVIFNNTDVAGGDVQINKSGGGVGFLFDVSAEQAVIGSGTVFTDADITLDKAGYLAFKETTTPTATPDYGKIYAKSTNDLFFQDGAGVEHTIDLDGVGGGGASAGVSGSIQFSDGAGGFLADGANIFWDNSSKRLGVGTNTPENAFESKTTGASQFTKSTAVTATAGTAVDLLQDTSNDMVNGFGINLRYGIRDSAAVFNLIGHLQFVRDGADNEGKFTLKGGTNGSEDFFTIDSVGKTTFNVSVLSGGDVEILSQTTGVTAFFDVSDGQVVIGSNTNFTDADITLDTGGYLAFKETTTPTATPDYGKLYTKSDNILYFQDGAGIETSIGGAASAGVTGSIQFSDGAGGFLADGANIFWDNANDRLGIGTATPDNTIHAIVIGGGNVAKFENSDSATATQPNTFVMKHTTDANMVDGFGVSIIAKIEDATSGDTNIGRIVFKRDSADNEGTISIFAGTNGAEEFLTILQDGKIGFNSPDPENSFEIKMTGAAQFTKTTAVTTTTGTAIDLLQDTSGNMADGFGINLRYAIRDSAAVFNIIGKLEFVRDGADNEGKFNLKGGTDGDEIFFTIDSAGDTSIVVGNLDISATGKGLGIKEGAATDSVGSATLAAGTVTVSNTNIATGDIIMLSRFTIGGTTGILDYIISNGASFTINSDSNTDTSVVNYQIIRTL